MAAYRICPVGPLPMNARPITKYTTWRHAQKHGHKSLATEIVVKFWKVNITQFYIFVNCSVAIHDKTLHQDATNFYSVTARSSFLKGSRRREMVSAFTKSHLSPRQENSSFSTCGILLELTKWTLLWKGTMKSFISTAIKLVSLRKSLTKCAKTVCL